MIIIANNKITVINSHPIDISDNQLSKVFITNNIIEVITTMNPQSNINKYKKINIHHCVDINTGLIIEYKKSRDRLHDHTSLKSSFATLRRIINANFVGDNSELHIVLTYAQPVLDYKDVVMDFSRFWKRFHYHHPDTEFIRIIEPHRSGRWHIHVLIKSSVSSSSFDQDQLEAIWGLGRVYVGKLPFVNNFGAYFSARLSNVDVLEDTSLERRNAINKMIVKGGRLKYYPAKFKFYSCSRGIIKPVPVAMKHGDVRQLVDGHKPIYAYSRHIMLESPDGPTIEVNAINYEQFNNNHKED